jgi:hypothetical protein
MVVNRTEQLVSDLRYLQLAGLTTDQLRSLHHWSDRPDAAKRVSFASAIDYFSKGQELKSNNSLFADRLRFIADAHRRGLAAPVEQALEKILV